MSPARSREPLERDAAGARILTHGTGGYARGCGCDTCTTEHTAYANRPPGQAPRTPRTPMPAGDKRSVITALGIYPGRNGWVTFRLKPAEATALSATTDPAAYLRSALAAHGVTTPASLTQHAAKAGKSRSQYARDILLNALNHQEGHQT